MSINAVDAKNKLDAETRQINIRRRDQKMELSTKCREARAGLGDANRSPIPPHQGSKKSEEALSEAAKTPSEDARKVTAWKKYES